MTDKKEPFKKPSLYPNIQEEGRTGVEQEDLSSDEIITEPFDPTLIRISTQPMTIDLLLDRIENNALNLSPGFQRGAGIWSPEAQSRLIESILIRIPIPAFYMDASDEDNWLVVDGLQRLTTLKRFVLTGELKLSGLEFLTQFNGASFNDLTPRFKRRIKETQVPVYKIEPGTPLQVKFNIFRRINTGGLPLSSQEIRHALNQGKVTDFLAKLAQSNEFLKATDHGISDKRMADRECVLRFMAFTLTNYSNYTQRDFDNFLNETMSSINKMTEEKLNSLENQFLSTMKLARDIFGGNAFRKMYGKNYSRSPISKALFESWSVNLNRIEQRNRDLIVERKDLLVDRFIQLMKIRDFEEAISQGTGDVRKVHLRFEKIAGIIEEVLNDPLASSPKF